jgi:uroporphyrinogen III methyltransferase / synthase
VRYLLERLRKGGGETFAVSRGAAAAAGANPRAAPLILPSVKLAAMGPGTAGQLAEYHLRADVVPELFQAEALAASLCREAKGRRFLLARASRGREVLAEQLAAAGAEVEQIVVYSSVDVESPDPQIAAMLAQSQIDWITVTSSAIARSLARLFGDALRQGRLASISPLTSGVLRGLGYAPAVEAAEATLPALVAAVLGATSGRDAR